MSCKTPHQRRFYPLYMEPDRERSRRRNLTIIAQKHIHSCIPSLNGSPHPRSHPASTTPKDQHHRFQVSKSNYRLLAVSNTPEDQLYPFHPSKPNHRQPSCEVSHLRHRPQFDQKNHHSLNRRVPSPKPCLAIWVVMRRSQESAKTTFWMGG